MSEKQKEEAKETNEELVRTYQNGILRMLTSLFLAYEQAYRNNFSYNKLTADQMSKKLKENGCVVFTSVAVKEIIRLGLQPSNCLEQIVISLQIVLLLCEQKEIIDKSDFTPLLGYIIECITHTMGTDDKLIHVFEVFSLCAIIKILDRIPFTKAKDPLLDVIINDTSFLTKICLRRKFKPHTIKYVDILIAKIGQYPAYHKVLVNEIKDKVKSVVIVVTRRYKTR